MLPEIAEEAKKVLGSFPGCRGPKKMHHGISIQSVSLIKSTDGDLDLVPWGLEGSTAENKCHCASYVCD